MVLGYSPEVKDKSLLHKIPCTTENTMQSSKGGMQPIVLPAMTPMNHTNDQNHIITLKVQYWTYIKVQDTHTLVVTNSSLIVLNKRVTMLNKMITLVGT